MKMDITKIRGNFGERWVAISGGNLRIEDIEEIIGKVNEIDESFGTISQLFDAPRIAGREHILHASKLALEALENDRAFADSPSIELTCWVAGLRQINKSLDRVGINSSSEGVVLVSIGKNKSDVRNSLEKIGEYMGLEENMNVLEITDEKMESLKEVFSISGNRLDVSSLREIILEKVALLSLEQ